MLLHKRHLLFIEHWIIIIAVAFLIKFINFKGSPSVYDVALWLEALSNKATRDKYCSSASLRTASGTSLLLTVTLVVFGLHHSFVVTSRREHY